METKTLHPVKKKTLVIPSYIKQFRCIGAECEDTCCAGWDVTLDKKTHDALVSDETSKLSKSFKDNIKPNINGAATEKAFATMKMNPQTQDCNFLEKGLCAIHLEKGESFLPNSCFNFPRINYTFNNNDYQILSLGCPEAARLALLEKDSFNFEQTQLEIREHSIIPINGVWGFTPENMEEIRLFCLQLVQTEGIEIWEKMLVLGLFCESVNDLIKEKQQNQAKTIVKQIIKHLNSGELLDSMSNVRPNFEAQATLFSSFWRACNKAFKEMDSYRSEQQLKIINLVQKGIFEGADEEAHTNQEEIIENYKQGLSLLNQTLEQAPDFEKNVLINELLMNIFPFSGNSPTDNFLRLVSRLSLLRFMLAGVSKSLGEQATPNDLVITVQVFYRMFHHNENLIDFFANKVQQMGLDKLNKLIVLLKSTDNKTEE